MNEGPVVSFIDVSSAYDNHIAVSHITFSVQAGTIFAIIGPPNSGKSTLLSLMSGQIKKTGGKILIHGYDLDTSPLQVRKNIGIKMQNIAYDKQMRGIDFLSLEARKNGSYSLNLADSIFDATKGLLDPALLNQPFESYSTEQIEFFGIAAARIHHPQLLLIDEPIKNVSEKGIAQIADIVSEHVKTGGTVILTTTQQWFAEEYATDIAVLDEGKLLGVKHIRMI